MWKTYQSSELYGLALFKEIQQNQQKNQATLQKTHKTQRSVGKGSE